MDTRPPLFSQIPFGACMQLAPTNFVAGTPSGLLWLPRPLAPQLGLSGTDPLSWDGYTDLACLLLARHRPFPSSRGRSWGQRDVNCLRALLQLFCGNTTVLEAGTGELGRDLGERWERAPAQPQPPLPLQPPPPLPPSYSLWRLPRQRSRSNPNPPRPLRLGLESAGAHEVGGVRRMRRLAKREAQGIRVSHKEASRVGLRCARAAGPGEERAPLRDAARRRTILPTKGKLQPGLSAQAFFWERNPGGGPRISGFGATNGRGGDSYRLNGCRGGRRGVGQGGSHRRDPRHGSADLDLRKRPARCRAGETVVGWKWRALKRRMGRSEARNADGEGPRADEWEEWRRRKIGGTEWEI